MFNDSLRLRLLRFESVRKQPLSLFAGLNKTAYQMDKTLFVCAMNSVQ
jgi:hypothetical protein